MTDNEVPHNNGQGQPTESVGADEEAVRARAYEISQEPDAGSPEENWHRAIAELRSQQHPE